MDRELKRIGIIAQAATTLFAAALGIAPAAAQTVTGVLGQPSATTTISGNQLPPPPPKFGGVIKESAKDSKPWWPPRVVPPKGAPNVLLIMTDDQGYGVSGTFGGVIPTPALDRVAKAGLRYTHFNSTALCSPTRAALITGRNHHSAGFGVISELSTGYPGYDSIIGPDKRDRRPDPERQRLRHFVVRQEPQHAGLPVQHGRARSSSGRREWGSSISTASWAAKPTSGSRISFKGHDARSSRGSASPATTSQPTSRTKRSRTCAASTRPRRTSRSSSTTCPGGTHSPHQPTKEWIEKFKGKFDMGWEKLRERDFRQPEAAGRDPSQCQAHAVAGGAAAYAARSCHGTRCRREKETLCAPGRSIRRLCRLYRLRDRPRDPVGRGHGQARQHADHLHRAATTGQAPKVRSRARSTR